ncbi:MAG TPA: PAS domain S-box protein [Vicinamibacterales bacterium]
MMRCRRRLVGAMAATAFVVASLVAGEVSAAPAKNVLILRGAAADLPGGIAIVDAIQSTVRSQYPGTVEFYLETVDTARFTAPDYDQRLAELYQETYENIPLDLVVAIAAPAVDFALRHRARVFPNAQLLAGFIDERSIGERPLPNDIGVVFVHIDTATTMRMVQTAFPAARRVLVISGSSPFDRSWLQLTRPDLDRVRGLTVVYDDRSSLEAIIEKVRSLPADTIVLYVTIMRDGAGAPQRPREVLKALRQVSPVPIFGQASTFLGYGIIGGALLDFDRHGADLGREALRLLSGEPAQRLVTQSTLAVDWRELRRFGIAEATLPVGTTIAFKTPSWWEQNKVTALIALSILLAQSATILGLVIAVRRRRQAQASLADSARLKGAILDSLPAQVAVLDSGGTVIAVNASWDAFAHLNGGSSAGTGVGASYVEVCRRAAADGCAEAAEALALIDAACRGEPLERTLEHRCERPGEERWFLMRVQSLLHPEGGAVVTHADITSRKQDEIALRESEIRFRLLADGLPVAVWLSDPQGACTYFNQLWLQLTGRAMEEQLGDGWLASVHPDDRAMCRDTYQRALAERQRFTMDYRLVGATGEYRWMMDVGMPRYGTDGEFHGYVGGCIDITERRNAEELSRDLSRRLMSAQEAERRRIARELHDHTSQQLALLALDLQQAALHPPASQDVLGTALNEAWRRATEIASDVHSISHRLHPSKLEVLGLVATIRGHCRDMARQGLQVTFADRTPDGRIAPEVSLSLFRVMEEALNNVVRHSGAAAAEVTLSVDDPDLVLRVQDNGRGFTSASPGNGLGLTSMRERLQSLGGTVAITSTPGKGTAVEARVPAARAMLPASVGAENA